MHEDLTGKKFNKLTVLSMFKPNNSRLWHCHCICECGNYKDAPSGEIKRGHVKSCGCYRKENNRTHGLSKSKIYHVYKSIKQRCYNANSKAFKNYGAKGIKLSGGFETFEYFYTWSMNNEYKDGSDIHRLDVDKDYTPNNCVWLNHNEHMDIHHKLRKKPILKIHPETNEILERFSTLTEAMKKYGDGIQESILKDKIRYGFKWKYEDEKFNKKRDTPKSQKRIYKCYKQIKQVCFNTKHPLYKTIGAKGITLGEDFKTFEDFEKWGLCNGYKDDLDLIRIDLNKNFTSSNCKWVTTKERLSRDLRKKRRKIAQIDPKTNEIIKIFDSVSMAMEQIGSGIDQALKDPKLIRHGFKWQYVD